MTAYDQVFYPIFGIGFAIAAIASVLAAWRSGFIVPGVLLLVGVIAFWAGLFIGSEVGYQTWQSIPDPPDEAFSDTFPLGALLFGWIPGGIFCGFAFAFGWLIRLLLNLPSPAESPSDGQASNVSAEFPPDDGNPYRSPPDS